jgi:uncharacterized delta-60 repeat protein
MGERGGRLGLTVLACLCAIGLSAVAASGLDRRFGEDGFVETPLSSHMAKLPGAPNIWDLAPIRGGFVAALTDLTDSQRIFGAARYRRNGALDSGFADGGFTRPLELGGARAQAQAVAVQGDGRIIVAGFRHGGGRRTAPLIARFRPGGSLDNSFGRDGVLIGPRPPGRYGRDRGEVVHDLAIQPGGRLITVGAAGEHGIGESARNPAGLVTAYRPDGRLDRSFGEAGRVAFSAHGGYEYTGLKSVQVLPDRRILVSGYRRGSLLLARLRPDGRLDRGFGGGDGTVEMFVNDGSSGCSSICWSAAPMALRADGRIVVLASVFPDVPVLLRLFPEGRLDRSFGRRGTVRLRARGHSFLGFGLALRRGGILVAGWDEARHGKARLSFSVFGRRGDGSVDRQFGRKGVLVRHNLEYSGAFATLNQPRGRVLVAGGGQAPEADEYVSFLQVARFSAR